ncbi:hypothetical protein NMD1_01517 [Novosphingobium sp. MD-1]|nr:hypothetical protein NMD1_01517 [Novosphingobium sp. MD-1]
MCLFSRYAKQQGAQQSIEHETGSPHPDRGRSSVLLRLRCPKPSAIAAIVHRYFI